MVLPEIPERKYVTEYLDDKHIERDFLQTHLYGILQDFMEAMQAKDYDKMGQIAEARFVNKLKTKQDKNDSSDWFTFKKVEHDPVKVVTVDKLFVKGVGIDRDTNDDLIDYTKITAMESQGLRQYVHKYDFGMQDYYWMLRY